MYSHFCQIGQNAFYRYGFSAPSGALSWPSLAVCLNRAKGNIVFGGLTSLTATAPLRNRSCPKLLNTCSDNTTYEIVGSLFLVGRVCLNQHLQDFVFPSILSHFFVRLLCVTVTMFAPIIILLIFWPRSELDEMASPRCSQTMFKCDV